MIGFQSSIFKIIRNFYKYLIDFFLMSLLS